MTNVPAGQLPVLAYLTTVAVSVPTALAAFALSRVLGSLARATATLLIAAAATVFVIAAVLSVGASPAAAVAFAATSLFAMAVLVLLPIQLGRHIVEWATGTSSERALRSATAGWPIALLASLVVFVFPGGPLGNNITFLGGPALVVALVALSAIVLLGPGLIGIAVIRLRDRQ